MTMTKPKELSEAEKFDGTVRTLLSVSHEEIKKRDEEWRHKREQTKRTKTPPAARGKR